MPATQPQHFRKLNGSSGRATLGQTLLRRGITTMMGCTRRLPLIAALLGIALAMPAQAEDAASTGLARCVRLPGP